MLVTLWVKLKRKRLSKKPEDLIDLSYLRSECFPFDSNPNFLLIISLRKFLPSLTAIEEKEIARSLAGFSPSKNGMTFDDTTFLADNSPRNLAVDDDDEGNEGFGFAFDGGNADMRGGDAGTGGRFLRRSRCSQ